MKRFNTSLTSFVAGCAIVASLAGCGTAASAMAGSTDAPSALQGASTTTKTANTSARAGQRSNAKSATVLVYMNGSDLESYGGEATSDIAEMLKANVGENVNVVIETLGTKQWQQFGIASDHAQRYRLNGNKLELVDDSLGQLDTTAASTLSDFIRWGAQNYPADRYMLLFWDHGAGPVYGFGYDEFQSDYASLTLAEIQSALNDNSNVHFDLIGMDCCLMSSMETCKVLAPYCDYTVLSEDFEPGVGWSYQRWLSMLEKDPGIATTELGTAIVDDMISAVKADPENGDATLALIDESQADNLYNAWISFAYANKDALLNTNYSQQTEVHGRPGLPGSSGSGMSSGANATNNTGHGQHGPGHGPGSNQNSDYDYGYGYGSEAEDGFGSAPDFGNSMHGDMGGYESWDYDMSYVTMSDYYVTDIMAVASSIDSDQSKALENAVSNAIVHYGCTDGEQGMTGIGVTLPYGDAEFYDELVDAFTACGIDKDYVAWLEAFVSAQNVNGSFDYKNFVESWPGWEDFSMGSEDYGTGKDYGWFDQYAA